MGRKQNEKFLDLYIALDKACADKFDMATGGVTEYINRLNNARFAPERDKVLAALIRYRAVRNALVHDPQQMKKNADIQKSDIAWMKLFSRRLARKQDPISCYLKKARRYVRRRRAKRVLLTGFFLLLLLLIFTIVLLLVLK